MVEATTGLDIARDMGSQRLAFRSNPINDWALHPLGVIGPSTIGTLLNLLVVSQHSIYIRGFVRLTSSAMEITSSSEDDMSRSSRPGTSRRSSLKTARSFRSLQLGS